MNNTFNSLGNIVITGASTGMGRACALYLDSKGFCVFAGVRKESDAESLKQVASERLTPILIDVTDQKSIEVARDTIADIVKEQGLAGLINNAGIGVTGPMEYMPISELRKQMDVNVIGPVMVTQEFLPLIRKAKGRIINIGSVGGKVTIPFGGPLCSSKHALESINDALRMELRPWGIHVCLIAPGGIKTTAVDKLISDSEVLISKFSQLGIERYAKSYRQFIKTFAEDEKAGASPEVMAEATFKALTAKKPKACYPVGPKSVLLPLMGRILPVNIFDKLKLKIFGLAKTV